MQTDFLSIRVMIVSSLILGTFLMHRIRNVLTNRVLKKSLGDHGSELRRPKYGSLSHQQPLGTCHGLKLNDQRGGIVLTVGLDRLPH